MSVAAAAIASMAEPLAASPRAGAAVDSNHLAPRKAVAQRSEVGRGLLQSRSRAPHAEVGTGFQTERGSSFNFSVICSPARRFCGPAGQIRLA